MANVSITQLPAYTTILSASGDVLPIVDVTNNTTKKISVTNLLAGLPTTAVTSVGLSAPDIFNISNSPITSAGTIALSWGSGRVPTANLGSGTASSATWLRGDGQWSPLPGSGTVTSVGLTVPSPLTVTGSPITNAGTFALDWGSGLIPSANLGTGTASANTYLSGAGTWLAPVGGGTVTSITAGTGLGAPTTGASITSTGTLNLLPATGLALGGVIVGDGLTVTAEGTLAATVPTLDQVLTAGNLTGQSLSVGGMSVTTAPINPSDVVRLTDLTTATSVQVNFRPPVAVTSTASVGALYTNNTGVGTATLTGTGTLTIDGVILSAGQRVLLVNQGIVSGATALGATNGSYSVTSNTGGSWTLTRTTDPLVYGNYHFVTSGTALANNSYILNTSGTITVGTTAITYAQFASNPSGAINNPGASGAPSAGTSTRYSREDHIHPFSVATATAASTTSLEYNNATGVLTFTPAVAGAGAVTSVALSTVGASPLTVTGSPVTSTGTLALAWGAGQIPTANLGAGSASATTFLAGDSQWRTTVTQVTASGVAPLNLTVTNPTSTPAITASWGTGQIPPVNLGTGTPTATNFLKGDGSWGTAVTSLSASGVTPLNLTVTNSTTTPTITASWGSGQIPPANLGTGTRGATVFLAGDGTWKSAVRSVALDVSGVTALTATGSPITSTGTFALGWGSGQIPTGNLGTGTASNATFLRGDGIWISPSTGTVTSVGLSMPGQFTVSGSPITSSGTFTVAWGTGQVPLANLASNVASPTQFLRGDGTWAAVGGVTSVNVSTTGLNGVTATGGPITSSGTIALAWDSAALIPTSSLGTGTADATTFLRGNGTWGPAVTSVDLSVPTGLTVTGRPITSSGTIAIAWDAANRIPTSSLGTGTASNTTFLRGDGTWVAPNSGTVTTVNAGTVATALSLSITSPTTTPTINLGFGSGLIPVANIGSGSGLNSQFLNGLGQFANVLTAAGLPITNIVNGTGVTFTINGSVLTISA